MDGKKRQIYVRTQLALTINPGDVVIWGNLTVATITEKGAWALFLRRDSPHNNPIEMAFSELKSLLCKAKAGTCDDLWKAVGKICNIFISEDSWSYFKAAVCVAH
jgi:transposase